MSFVCVTTHNIVNLDPAAENFDYPIAMDIRELISSDDVMEELGLSPNGGLIYCMEHLEENLDDWLIEELDNYLDDDYLVFDFPGQIELFSHVPMFYNFAEHLKRKNYNVCGVYLLDCQFITDVRKFVSGCMASLSAMVQLELPHVNILSKMDLVTNKRDIENYLDPEPRLLLSELNERMAPRFKKLNKSLIELVDEYSMVSFIPLNLRKESSMYWRLKLITAFSMVKIKDFDADDDSLLKRKENPKGRQILKVTNNPTENASSDDKNQTLLLSTKPQSFFPTTTPLIDDGSAIGQSTVATNGIRFIPLISFPKRMSQADVSYSCGSCGYPLHLTSSNRITSGSGISSEYRKSVKKGLISFLSVDLSRFTQVDEVHCFPVSWGRYRLKTKLLCRKCGVHIGYGYGDASALCGFDSPESSGAAYKKFTVKIGAVQPSEEC
ncbi:hypothetical protein V6N12_058685 [Hibiscus sabdariffa]|uniref:GPN-loop GTPase 3 n=1 Tax=Hibiscus sabdariffa TaxID=183260 RepID=A0ABR2ESV6_9ROSI